MYVCMSFTYVYNIYDVYICTYTYMHTCIHTYMHTYVHTYMHTLMQIQMKLRLCVCIVIYTYVCISAQVGNTGQQCSQFFMFLSSICAAALPQLSVLHGNGSILGVRFHGYGPRVLLEFSGSQRWLK